MTLEQADRSLDLFRRLTATAGHELRAPLGRVTVEAEDALQRVSAAQEALVSILGELRGLGRLLDALLNLAKDQLLIEGGSEVEVVALVSELVEDARILAREHGPALSFVPPLATSSVLGNRALLARAIWNLLENAVKYVPPGESVTVRLELAPSTVRVVVEDTGPGLDPGLLLFQPFQRGANVQATEGHGLGLALARSIARRHGGDAIAESPARGARLVLVLPAKVGEAERAGG
ncbi:MAG: sensor histidine kinase [Planctomycetota bacterium]